MIEDNTHHFQFEGDKKFYLDYIKHVELEPKKGKIIYQINNDTLEIRNDKLSNREYEEFLNLI